MLQSIRERAQGWIAWFIVTLITIPFALWGIQEYLGGGTETVVATVNGEEITERSFETNYRNFRQSLRQRLGQNYRPELLDEQRLRAQVLESMIQEELIRQTSKELGLSAGNVQIRAAIEAIPAFQVGGQFDKQAYERSIRQRGLNSAGFDARIRQSLVSEQLSRAVTDSAIVTDTELDTLIRLGQQQREFAYLLIPAANFLETVEITDEEARSYYDSHQGEFMAPERVRVEYLELDIARIAETLEANEEDLLDHYTQYKSNYIAPEQRQASHILILIAEDADESALAEARALAQSALDRVRGGEDFAAVAKELSQDPGSSGVGGDLGFFEKGIMEKAFEDKAFSMTKNEISDLVKSPFGFHIIKLTEIKPETGKSFEQARSDVEKAYLKSKAEGLYYEYAERLNDLAFEDPDSLEPVAEALGMEIKESDWIVRAGSGAGLFASPKVAGAAFSDDVLLDGHNSEAIEIEAEHVVVLRVKAHEEQAVRTYESVKEEIQTSLKTTKAAEQAELKGKEALDRLAQGESLDNLTQETGVTVKEKELVGRMDTAVPAPILKKAFQLQRPDSGQAIHGEAKLDNGDFAVIALYQVEDGKEAGAAELAGKDALKRSLQRSRGESYYRHLLQALRDSSEVKIIQ